MLNLYRIKMCKFDRNALRDKQKSTMFFIRVLKWPELKSVGAVSKVTRELLHKCSPALHLGDLLSRFKSLEREQSAFL